MNNEKKFIIITVFCLMQSICSSQIKKSQTHNFRDSTLNTVIPNNVCRLIKSYPNKIIGFFDNKIYFTDSTYLIYDDSIPSKDANELLNEPDIKDQFKYKYVKGGNFTAISRNTDPGRIRNELFFKKIYGRTKEEVRKNLVEIVWCPKLVNQKILVTKLNGVAERVKQISAEFDEMPQLKEYIKNIGGTFNWRNISGTNRLSMHSFGMTIDINTVYSNYWQWDCKCTNENSPIRYENRIPRIIVQTFEKFGFIWGGSWYHYDTMHFEYRPELLLE